MIKNYNKYIYFIVLLYRLHHSLINWQLHKVEVIKVQLQIHSNFYKLKLAQLDQGVRQAVLDHRDHKDFKGYVEKTEIQVHQGQQGRLDQAV